MTWFAYMAGSRAHHRKPTALRVPGELRDIREVGAPPGPVAAVRVENVDRSAIILDHRADARERISSIWVGENSESPAIRRDDRIVNVRWQSEDSDRLGTVERNDCQCPGRTASIDTLERIAVRHEAHRTETAQARSAFAHNRPIRMIARQVNRVPLHSPWTRALEVESPVERRVAIG